jgi:organic radical activating enzyme
VEGVLDAVQKIHRQYPAEWVCLTGGEPFLQPIESLVEQLKASGYSVQIETNGTLYRSLSADWWTLSPKPETYGFAKEFRTQTNEVKLVVSRELTLKTIQNLREQFPAQTPILLQPQSRTKWSTGQGMRLLRHAKKAGIKNIRLCVQIHKYIGVR